MFSMRQSISTKYLGPTEHHAARVKAVASTGLHVTILYDYALSSEENHIAAAKKIARRFRWGDKWVAASLPGKTGFEYVFVSLPAAADEQFCFSARE